MPNQEPSRAGSSSPRDLITYQQSRQLIERLATSAAERGAKAERIMDHTGHQSVGMIRVYTRRSDAFADHAGAGLL